MAYKPLIDTETVHDKCRCLETEVTALKLNNKQLTDENAKLKKSYKIMVKPMQKIMEMLK